MSVTIRTILTALLVVAFLGWGVMPRIATASPSMVQTATSPGPRSQMTSIDPVDGTFAAPLARRPAVATIIRRVAAAYGETKPHIIRVQPTTTDSTPHEPMYFVMLSGRFHRGRMQATYLYFSAIAGRWLVWGIQGYNAHHRLVWIDARLPSRRR